MITPRGMGFLAAAVSLLLLARLTQVGWLYLLDSVLWGALLLSAILPWLATPFLAGRRRVVPQGTVGGQAWPSQGDSVEIEVLLRNRVFWPRFLLNLVYPCPAAAPGHQQIRAFIAKLPGSRTTTLTSVVEAYARGNHPLGPVMVESSAPFGLIRRRTKLAPSQAMLVYPKVMNLSGLAIAQELSDTGSQRRLNRQGLEPVGARRYVLGDPRHHIHWQNTARTGRPMVKEFQEPSQRVLHLVFDARRPQGDGRETTLEYAIKIVASAASFAYRISVPVHVHGGGFTGGGGQGNLPWMDLMERLALTTPGEGESLVESLDSIPNGSNVLAVTPLSGHEWSDETGRALLNRTTNFQDIVVVNLEGFGQHAAPLSSGILANLESAGVPVIVCRPGGLGRALEALGKVGVIYPATAQGSR